MAKIRDHANHNAAARGRSGQADAGDMALWSADEEEVSGRSWSLILVFIFVPLIALAVLGIVLFALFTQIFGGAPTP
jgi:hypothetical protein